MRIKPILQVTNTECGLCCMAMLAEYYGFIKPMSYFRKKTDVGRDGMSVQLIRKVFSEIHFDTEIIALDDAIRTKCFPGIVHIRPGHFVVVEKYYSSKRKIIIIDPSVGKIAMDFDEFCDIADGFLLYVFPGEGFEKEKDREHPWRELAFLLDPIKGMFCMSVGLSFASYFFTLSIPRIVQSLVDQLSLENKVKFTTDDWMLPILAALLFILISIGRNLVLVKLETIVDERLLNKFIGHILALPYKYFETRSSGDLMFRINLLNSIRLLISEGLVRGIIDIGSLFFVLGYMIIISWQLSAAMILALIIVFIVATIFNKRIITINKKELQCLSKVTSVETEILEMIFDIKSLKAESLFIKKLDCKYQDFKKQFKKRETLARMNVSVLQFFQLFIPFFVILLSLNMAENVGYTIGKVMAFYTLSNMAINMSISIVQEVSNIRMMRNYILRINDVLQEDLDLKKAEKRLNNIEEVSVVDVSFKYSDNSDVILNNINMKINKGQKVAIVGESGAGKSTLIRLLLGLYTPTKGLVQYNDVNINEVKSEMFRSIVGVIPQDIRLFNDTIKYNVTLGEDVSDQQVIDALKKVNLYDEVEKMPLKENTVITMGGKNFSSGQRQRIAIARLLICLPQVVVLDEATNSLDGINENEIMNYLDDLSDTQIIVSHRFSTICNADYVYLIKDGHIEEEGTVRQLIDKNGAFVNLFRRQISIMSN